MKHQKIVLVLLLLGAGLLFTVSNLEADFVQCVGQGNCTGTNFDDIINGNSNLNGISGLDGNDTIFGGDNPFVTCQILDKTLDGPFVFGVPRCMVDVIHEILGGNGGNDFISGGPGLDVVEGGDGNDVLLANTDLPGFAQFVRGNNDNDSIYVLVGDVAGCLFIEGGTGFDVANLIGFGPFSVQQPFGMTGFTVGWIHLVDPIGGGDIFIQVDENGDDRIEGIHGLLSPNVTFIPGEAYPLDEGCEPNIT